MTDEEIARIRESLGELPAALRKRLEQTWGLMPYDSDVLVNQGRALVGYYLAVAEACGRKQPCPVAGHPFRPGA